MRVIKWVFISILAIIVLLLTGVYFFLKNTAPDYSGDKTLKGLENEVLVKYDNYGIPHISAESEKDAYFALGYVQAKDRIFQMDLLRRLTSGRLAEILGPELLETDKLMLTLGLKHKAKKSAEKYMSGVNEGYQIASMAYLEGINQYMRDGQMPIEYSLLDLPREEFAIADIYAVINFMSLGFSFTTKEDAMIAFIYKKLGGEYIKDMKLSIHPELRDSILKNDNTEAVPSLSFIIEKEMNKLGMSQWWGSNSWVIGKEKSKSGQVLFANDTHMGYGQPAVWYEAHLKFPGREIYGHYLPLIPFGVLGHTREMAWGLTIFPFDNVNYYVEKLNPADSNLLMFNNEWTKIESRKEKIKIKDQDDIEIEIRSSKHGPIINDIDPNISSFIKDPVSLWWTVLQFDSQALDAMYRMNNSTKLEEFSIALPMLDVVGLYVNYGDAAGNIAWWATGKLPVFRDSLNTSLFLQGHNGEDEVLGYHDFSKNPQLINPAKHFVATANNDPVLSGSHFVEGNYLQPDRINRINKIVSGDDEWDIEKMKKLQLDHKSDRKEKFVKVLVSDIDKSILKEDFQKEILSELEQWDGAYDKDAIGPVIFEKLLYLITKETMADELDANTMKLIYNSFLYKRSIYNFFENEKSVWWDDINTPEHEIRRDVFTKAFIKTCSHLKEQHGNNLQEWRWEDVHIVTYEHAFGQKKPLDRFFNVGPFKIEGGNNVLNKMEYPLTDNKINKVLSGPTVRILLDFAEVEKGLNINPTGQSGNVMSSHYDDQAKMFVNGKYRRMLMDEVEINNASKDILLLKPEK